VPIVYDSSKPFATLDAIAKSLGWRGLQLWRHTFDDRVPVYWYQMTDQKFMLWITEYPLGQNDVFAASVYADRYGICSGAHKFTLSDAETISSLSPWIARMLFRDAVWRRDLYRSHPECCLQRPTPRGCIKKRSSGEWPPYEPFQLKPQPPHTRPTVLSITNCRTND
jgi:hypothetical protein